MEPWLIILCSTALPLLAIVAIWAMACDGSWEMPVVVICGFLALTTLIIGVAGVGEFLSNAASCNDHGNQIGLPARYVSNFSGCYVKFGGQWIPYDRWLYLTQGTVSHG